MAKHKCRNNAQQNKQLFQDQRNEKHNQSFIPDKMKMGKPSKKPMQSLEEE